MKHSLNGHPFDPKLAQSYDALDLPYGTPPEIAARQWKRYLKKCHPDRHQGNPDMLAAAQKLTRILTEAYENIQQAWSDE